MTDPSTPPDAVVLGDRYVLLAQIGSGGAGVVWRAHDRVLDRVVAVKRLHPELVDDHAAGARFRAEATAAAKLTHPNAVIVYDVGRSDAGDYLVMELVDGTTLAEVLAPGPLAPGVVAALGTQLGRALGAGHARGLVHRDVKPANVLVTTDGVAKVADFGVARALGDATARLTMPGRVMGTARYLAPEQLQDDTVDGRSDVYSLGLLLHEAVTGEPPFGDGTAIEVAMRRIGTRLARASEYRGDVPAALDDAIARATEPDPADRFGDGVELANVLARLAAVDAGRQLAARVGGGGAATAAAEAPTAAMPPTPAGAPTAAAAPTAAMSATRARPPEERREATDATAALDDAPRAPGAGEHAGNGRSRRPVWLGLAALLVVGLGLMLMTGDDGEGPDDTTTTDDTVLDVAAGGEHDPFGDGGEHPDTVSDAFDGDASTFWRTHRYTREALGGLKPGVGLWLDLGDPQEVSEVSVSTTNPGATFTLYTGDTPPDAGVAPDDWGTAVAEVTDAGEEARVELDDAEGRVWMLWFTLLPPDGDDYRATVTEVRFHR